MRIRIWMAGIGLLFTLAGRVLAAPTPLADQTMPVDLTKQGQQYYLRLFQTVGGLVSLEEHGEAIFVSALYVLQTPSNYKVCGSGLLGKEHKVTLFVVTHENNYVGLDADGWAKHGCQERGGTELQWVPRKDGSGGEDIRAFRTASPSLSTKPPAVPSRSLPFGERQRIAAEFEDSLSQTLGAEVTLLSDRNYKEQDGTSMSCIEGIVKGERFRMVHSGDNNLKINPTHAEWIAAGCERPNYLLIR